MIDAAPDVVIMVVIVAVVVVKLTPTPRRATQHLSLSTPQSSIATPAPDLIKHAAPVRITSTIFLSPSIRLIEIKH